MNDLETNVTHFVDTLEKHNITALFERMEPQDLVRMTQGLPISNELLTWYRNAAPKKVVIPWCFGNLEFFAPVDLLDLQTGYRWTGRKGGPRDLQWAENWVVIADVYADPIIANVTAPQTPILMDFHGTGKWNPKPVSSSLGEFLMILSLWVEISIGKYENRYKTMQEYDESFVTQLKADFSAALDSIVSRENRQNLFEFLI